MNITKTLMRAALGARRPDYQHDFTSCDVERTVAIERDAFGVPYVWAETEGDAWYGVGFALGQDRATQLEILFRVVRGTLSELVGKEGIAMDRLSRRLGFRRVGVAQLRHVPVAIQRQAERYTQGIYDGATIGLKRNPHELTLLGATPTRFDAADVLGYFSLFAFGVASNWDMELLRYQLLMQDGEDALRALEPHWTPDLPVSWPPSAAPEVADELTAALTELREVLGEAGGSNAWVVGPEKTATGRPILANDPHLSPMAPGAGYLARIACPQFTAAGVLLIGVPAFATGHNGYAAWGVTAAHADNTDLFLEQVSEDGTRVLGPQGWEPCEVRDEVIRVKGQDPIIERVTLTPRGPILSPALDAPMPPGLANALSIAGPWLTERPYVGFMGVHHATSFDHFREQFRAGSDSSVSVVYADADGHIGWTMGVEIPVRHHNGLLPGVGWREGASWTGWIPFDDMPWGIDPPEGYIAAANNMPVPSGERPELGVDFLDGYRVARISERLAEHDAWTVAEHQALQLDVLSVPWRELRKRVLKLARGASGNRKLRRALRKWDGRMDRESVGATVYTLFMVALVDGYVREHAPQTAAWALGRGYNPVVPHNLIFTRRLRHIVALVREGDEAEWRPRVHAALKEAKRRGRKQLGALGKGWRWGYARPMVFAHPFAEQAPLDRVFNVEVPTGGDASTVAQAAVDFEDPLGPPLSVAVSRSVIDVGDWDKSRFVLGGGQSGNPLSTHYADQVPLWNAGEGIPIPFDERAAHARAVTRASLRG